ncbi:MAG: hypothetical protein R2807_06020 [Chitinophagales bacterium]
MKIEEFDRIELDKLIDIYFKDYFENKYHSLYLRVINIKNYFEKKQSTSNLFSEFIYYVSTLIKNEDFVTSITSMQIDINECNKVILNIHYHFTHKINDITPLNLLYFSPDELILFIINNINSNKITLTNPINYSPINFTIKIKEVTSSQPIYFLYDLTQHIKYCEYVGKIMPINNREFSGVYDYHFPIFKLIEKYATNSIILTTDKHVINEHKYIYVHTIEHIYDFFNEHGTNFYKTIPKNIFNDINKGKAILIYNSAQEGLTISNFYYLIINSLKENFNIRFINNIIFLSGNYYEKKSVDKFNNKQIIPSSNIKSIINNLITSIQQNNRFNSFPFRYFEECISIQYARHYKHYSYETKMHFLEYKNFKTFLCFNGHQKIFRYAFVFLLWENNLLQDGFVSLRKLNSVYECSDLHQRKLIKKILLSDLHKFEIFKKQLPLKADKENLQINYWYQVSLDLVNNTFLWIVTETTFGGQYYNFSFSFLTEKIYKPIIFFMPFVVVGDRNTLKILKEEGYQTFSRWWNEDYDSIYNKVERMNEIIKIVKEINSKSKDELILIYREMKPILEHNFKNLITKNSGYPIYKKISNLYFSNMNH